MNDKDVTITIKATSTQLVAALKGLRDGVKNASNDIKKSNAEIRAANDRLGDSFESIRSKATMALAAIGVSAVAGLGMAVSSAGDFQSSLSQLKQTSGATASEMQALTQRARDLGKDNSLAGVTASKAAQAMVELSKAGLSVKDTMDASKGVMSLAKAGNLEYAEAATIAASALNAFSMKGSEASKVADALAAGANASQADLSDLALGLQQSATVAKQFKLTLNDNVTALALFANNGIRGSDAGTSLKTMLIALANPSDNAAAAMKAMGFNAYDAKGKFVGLKEMSARLAKGLGGLTDSQKQQTLATIFGTDAFRAAAVLADNAGQSYDSMAKAVGRSGSAQEAAAAQQGSYQKSLENFSNAISDVGLTVGEKLLPPITDFINTATQEVGPVFDFLSNNAQTIAIGITAIGLAFATIRMAGFISDLKKAQDMLTLITGAKNANGIRAIGSAFASTGSGIKNTAKWLGSLSVSAAKSIASGVRMGTVWVVSLAKIAASAAVTAAKAVAGFAVMGAQALVSAAKVAASWFIALGPIGWITAAVIALTALIIANWSTVKQWLEAFGKWLQDMAAAAWAGITSVWNGAVAWFTEVWTGIQAAFAAVGTWFTDMFTKAWNGIKTAWSAVGAWFKSVWSTITAVFSSVRNWFVDVFTGAWNGIKNVFSSVGGFFRGVWDNIVSIFGKVGTSIGNAISGAVKGVVNKVLGFAETTINGFIRAINGAIGLINNIPGVNIGKLGLLNIPRMETGGIVPATAGGRQVIVAEGGQDEWVAPESKMASLVSQVIRRIGDTGGTNKEVVFNNTYNVKTQTDIQRISSDMGYLASRI